METMSPRVEDSPQMNGYHQNESDAQARFSSSSHGEEDMGTANGVSQTSRRKNIVVVGLGMVAISFMYGKSEQRVSDDLLTVAARK